MLAISPAQNPAVGIASSAHAAPTRADKDARAFCRRFPNAVAIDDRVTAALLVALAYRSTWTGSTFGLNEVNLAKVVSGKGLGRNKIRRTVALGKDLGYLTREHNSKAKRVWKKGRKHFAKARDTLHLPGCSDNDGRIVWRQWFEGSFSVNELAAVLFIRAHGKTHARQLAERFGWSRPTAAKVIGSGGDAAGGDGLLALGLLVKTVERKPDGTIKGITYEVPQLSAKRLAPAAEPAAVKTPTTVKKPCNGGRGDGQPCNGKAVDTRRVTPHVPLTGGQSLTHSEDPHHHLHAQHSQQASAGARETIFHEAEKTDDELQKLLDRAHDDPALLGWLSCESAEIRELPIDHRDGYGQHGISDDELRRLLKAATTGRVHGRILSEVGLAAVRLLASANSVAASDVWTADGCVHGYGFDDALCDLLNVIDHRVGKNPQVWLNSLKLVGPRFLEAVNEGLQSDDTYAWPLLVYGEYRFRTNKYGGHHEPDILDTEDPVWLAKRAAFEALPWTAQQGGTQLPADWTLSDDLREWSLKLRPDLGLEVELDLTADAFRDYWHGRKGANSYKQDWRAAWRKHWRKAVAGYAVSEPGCDAMECEHDKDRAVANFLAGGEWDPVFGDPPDRPVSAAPDLKTRVA